MSSGQVWRLCKGCTFIKSAAPIAFDLPPPSVKRESIQLCNREPTPYYQNTCFLSFLFFLLSFCLFLFSCLFIIPSFCHPLISLSVFLSFLSFCFLSFCFFGFLSFVFLSFRLSVFLPHIGSLEVGWDQSEACSNRPQIERLCGWMDGRMNEMVIVGQRFS